jgi:hypothetical protein
MTAGLVFYPKSHRYKLDGQWVPGVTTLIGKGLPKPALPYWSAKMVAEWVADNPDLTEDLKRMGGRGPAVAFLKELPWAKRDEAAIRGTDVHALAEKVVNGEEVDVPEHLAAHVQGYVDWLDTTDLVPILTERPVASRQWQYAGTFDLIANLEGQTYLLDIKTSSGVYGSTALQLTAYGNAEFYLDQDGTEQPMPTIDRYGVLHVTDYGTTLHYLPADQNEAAWKDFLHVQFVGRRAKQIDTYLTEEITNV